MNDTKNYSKYGIEKSPLPALQDTEKPLGFCEYYINSVWNYSLDFSAPMPRRRFWISIIFMTILLGIAFTCLSKMWFSDVYALTNPPVKFGTIIKAFMIGMIIIYYCVKLVELQVRRLKDANKSGWLVILSFIPILNIVPLVLYFLPGSGCLKTVWTKQDTIAFVYLIIVLGGVSICLIL